MSGSVKWVEVADEHEVEGAFLGARVSVANHRRRSRVRACSMAYAHGYWFALPALALGCAAAERPPRPVPEAAVRSRVVAMTLFPAEPPLRAAEVPACETERAPAPALCLRFEDANWKPYIGKRLRILGNFRVDQNGSQLSWFPQSHANMRVVLATEPACVGSNWAVVEGVVAPLSPSTSLADAMRQDTGDVGVELHDAVVFDPAGSCLVRPSRVAPHK